MRKPIPLDLANYKAGLLASLFSVIMENSATECSPELNDLIAIAADLNQEIYHSLKAELNHA
ncbi:hypothetical protein [Pragia fontium]|uniref:hypothetical protein n=1 Tax=Pragia fontium TaxID=82985 RepID=UPI00064B169B|nr:hypothetical protein [Pragia fontium]AKJ41530.1 hypothetical protein QQ39_05070 [Pragia fontium]